MGYCQLVVFNFGLEEYAINISYAQEIFRIPKFSRAIPVFDKSSIQGISIIGHRIIILLNDLNLKSEISKYDLEKLIS